MKARCLSAFSCVHRRPNAGLPRRSVPRCQDLRLCSVAPRYTLVAGNGVIETIRHKGLRRLYEKNDRSGIRADLVEKVQKILSGLEAANGPEDMALPLFRFHRSEEHTAELQSPWKLVCRLLLVKKFSLCPAWRSTPVAPAGSHWLRGRPSTSHPSASPPGAPAGR